MRYIWQHVSTIISTYRGEFPLAHFIRNYCKHHPKLGSRDRKMLNDMAFSWYRCSKGVAGSDIIDVQHFEATMKACLQICSHTHIIERLFTETPATEAPLFDVNGLFTQDLALSAGIAREEWLRSILKQPALFIRIRKNEDLIVKALYEHEIPFTFISETCLSLPNGAKIDELLLSESYVVQDASSQLTGEYFNPQKSETWYDACSGAGGKSLLLKDMEPSVQLTVTDVRESILHNLKERFRQYNITAPMAYVTNVFDKDKLDKTLGARRFDNIICDVPCSGSGTWARTPEQMYFFDPATLNKFLSLQSTIAINVSRFLKPGGKLIYITCSVFKEENENVVEKIVAATGLKVQQTQLINGIKNKADSMFVTVMG